MENLTPIQERMLEVIDVELAKVTKILAKAEPWIKERDRLLQMRRVLLAEKATTGGGGRGNALVTMEQMIVAMRSFDGEGVTPPRLEEVLHVDQTVIRNHLNRYKGERYEKRDNNLWYLIGEDADADTDDEDDD